MSLLSRVAASRRSYSCADGPPTRPAPPIAARSFGIVSSASREYGAFGNVTLRAVPASPEVPGRTWPNSLAACVTRSTLPRSGTTMSVGADAPAAKLRVRISWPVTLSTSPRNWLSCV